MAIRRPVSAPCVLLCLASAAAHGADLGALFEDKRAGTGIGPKNGFNLGIGGFLAYRTDGFLGTRANFLLRGSYCWTRVCLSAAHLSHGRIFGLDEHSANKGLNFLYLEYRFK